MAKFYLSDYVVNNSFNDVVAVSWEISLDPDFLLLVDETIFNTKDILVWSSPLKRIDGNGYYDDTAKMFIRVKIYTRNNGIVSESDWFYSETDDNLNREIKITDKDGIHISSIKYTFDGFERIW